MATHSSTLGWKIPWREEPGRLQFMGSKRVGHDWATSLSLFTFTHWSRKWQPIPVFLPGESHGWGSLMGCHLWGHTESDTTEATYQQQQLCSWHHPYGRKQRETTEPLDESQRVEWKSWLKTQHSKNEDHGIQSHYVMANRWGNNGNSDRLYFPGLQNHCRWWLLAMKLKDACSLEDKLWQI